SYGQLLPPILTMRVRPITLETFYTTGGGIEKQSLCGNNQHVWIPPSRWHGGISVSVISTPWEMRTWRAQILTKQSRQPLQMPAFSTSGTNYGNGSGSPHTAGCLNLRNTMNWCLSAMICLLNS